MFELEQILQQVVPLIVSAILGGFVGLERELTEKPAGLRTHMLVSLGSCLFTIVSVYDFQMDPARIAAGIVAGIGFIGAGAVLSERDRVVGLTTAASLWVTAAIGLSTGVGNYVLSFVTTALVVVTLFIRKIR
jgi:putative Mg2+ transporter-C (MgtC) family protein